MKGKEIRLWIENDEPLYLWWKSSRQSMKSFVREHSQELIRYIKGKLS